MTVINFHEDRVMFGVNVPSKINAYLQNAVAAAHDPELAESLLWEAHRLDPEQLEVYLALYKFYFYRNRVEEAESVVLQALNMCSKLGEFDADWNKLTPECSNWYGAETPQRMYLYSLKALCFISLRKNNFIRAKTVLDKLEELDPTDQVGGSVLRDMAEALESEI